MTKPATSISAKLLHFPLTRAALLYRALTYLYLSGFFFRATYTQGPMQAFAATLMAGAMMLMAYAMITGFTERRPVTELALPAMGRELVFGLLLGAGIYSLCVLILMLLGNYHIAGTRDWHQLLPGLAVAAATGVYEELWFRGTIFRLIEEWLGSWWALVASSLLFGYVHLDNEAATLQGIASITVWAGPLLTGCFLLTRRLWLGIGLHAAWNYTQGSVYSGSVSGNAAPDGLIVSQIQGSHWLTGGAFGLEASLVAVIVGSGAGILMLVQAKRRGNIIAPAWRR